ncbi:hypothetical protein FA13DRAFT_1788822 [Coprinellus micaceus]|uniref:Rgp1-domain-containing protein n=1 Tax=Coprinellus micaceus TaxID=71717 RepID=A0A4Y7TNW8_COPMI|nr:hypothetical protein FA13DRAFT_1788822 [Coprinellus micaceus]
MLAVDLVLAPGESRSYTYTVNLPDNLPPTFRGKAIHFSYELVVGLCRSGQSDSLAADGLAEHGGANVSKLMKVPIRMYNNVVVEHPPKPYNLLWPVDKRMDLAMPSSQATVTENDLSRLSASARPRSTSKGKAKGKDGLEEFLRYTARLLNILPPPELQPEHSVGATPYQNELEVEPREGEDGHAESPTTPSPPRRETPAPEDDIPEPDSPPLDPITPTSSNTPSEMSLSPHPSRSASSSPPPPSSQTSAPPPSSPPEALQDLTKPTTRPAPRKPAMLDLSFESHRGRQSHECSVGSNRGSSAVRTHEEGDGGGGTLGSGCREAVEILTRTQKKASYDVTKDGVKVAILTFPKSSYRLGETISGVVEINERKGRARVVQLAAFLEAHESLPSSLFPPSANRYLKRTYTEHFSSHLLNTLRTTFSLDIPSDASPAFQTCVGTPKGGPNTPGGTTSFGGLEWKVRLCLLVAVAGGKHEHGEPKGFTSKLSYEMAPEEAKTGIATTQKCEQQPAKQY